MIHRDRLARGAVMGTALAMALGGCAAVTTRYAHGAAERQQPIELQRRDQAVIARLPDAEVAIQAQDAARTLTFVLPLPIPIPPIGSRRPPPHLPIWLELVPRSDSLWFDPLEMRIVTESGDTLRPRRYWGPGVGSRSDHPGNGLCRCGVPSELGGVRRGSTYHQRWEHTLQYRPCFNCGEPPAPMPSSPALLYVDQPSCFVIEFPHPPSYTYSLLFSGIEVAGRREALPPLIFHRGDYWSLVAVIPLLTVWI
jgi:hypothetical protein